jgi:hypothetical protein
MNNPQMILNPDLYQASQRLADSIRQAKPIAAYLYAKERMESDPTAKSLLERFAAAQAELRVQQSNQAVLLRNRWTTCAPCSQRSGPTV